MKSQLNKLLKITFVILFFTLSKSYSIEDLSELDPYFVLPIIMGASMFFQQMLNPTPPDPTQAKIMKWMPVMFTVFFLWFPSGLVLYWVVNNLLSIAQQYVITKRIESAA